MTYRCRSCKASITKGLCKKCCSEEYDELQSKITLLESSERRKTLKVFELERSINALKIQNSQLKESMTKTENQNSQLRKSMTETENRNSQLRKSMNETENQNSQLKKSMTETENQNSRLKKSMAESEKKYSVQEESIQKAKSEKQALLKIKESILKAFNDKETSDVTFIVEGEELYAHKSLLEIRCEHFRTMFKDCWQEKDKPVEISQSSFRVYKALLYYAYSDDVDSLALDDLIQLMDLAISYFETDLKEKCEDLLIKEINEETVAKLYAAAVKYEAKELNSECLHFCMGRMAKIVKTGAFQDLDGGVAKLMVQDLALNGLID